MLIVDAHLDLAMNALEWNRDLTRPIDEIRARERQLRTSPIAAEEPCRSRDAPRPRRAVRRHADRALRRADNPLPGWHSQEQAWAKTQGQLAWYRAMEERGELVQIGIARRSTAPRALAGRRRRDLPIGYILSLEGADSLVTPRHLERAYADGLRAIGPAHYGPGVYATGRTRPVASARAAASYCARWSGSDIILDATHLCDDSFWEALDHFRGPVWASHSNCRALVPHNRQFSDEQIRELIQRGAVIGAALDAWMLVPGWVRGESTPGGRGVTLETRRRSHRSRLSDRRQRPACGSAPTSTAPSAANSARRPRDHRRSRPSSGDPAPRGYRDEDVAGITHGNVVRFLRGAWS